MCLADTRFLPRKWGEDMVKKIAPPVHPGEILLEEFLKPMEISQYRLAKDIGVPARRISADTALRLSRYFGLTEPLWLNLQMSYDLEPEKDKLAGRLAKEVKPHVPQPDAG